MSNVSIFYDSKGKPEFAQIPYGDYKNLIEAAKESTEQKTVLKKIADLASALAS